MAWVETNSASVTGGQTDKDGGTNAWLLQVQVPGPWIKLNTSHTGRSQTFQ